MASAAPLRPIFPEFAPRVDPEYLAFYNENQANELGLHEIPWTPDLRLKPPQPGGSQPLKVGDVRDKQFEKFAVRIFTPEGERPKDGWPIIVYFHGGGWTLGNINTENAFSSNLCKRAKTIVFSVDYSLAPENPYPAAINDAWTALQWVHSAEGQKELGHNPAKVAVGGSSSGGNLAAILTHKAALAEPPIPLAFQLLNVPVVDNTAPPDAIPSNPYPSWYENAHTPSLTPAKMLWFRGFYLPDPATRSNWDASPIFAPDDSFAKSPPAWIGVCELDVLRDEGLKYGEKLSSFGKEVDIVVYRGAPHPVMAMDGVLSVGRKVVTDACKALAKAMGTAYTDV